MSKDMNEHGVFRIAPLPWRYDAATRQVVAADGMLVCTNGDPLAGVTIPEIGEAIAKVFNHLAVRGEEISKLNKQVAGLTHQLAERDKNIRTLTQDRDLALSDASKWRNHVMRFERERFPNEMLSCAISTQLFFTLSQPEREKLLEEQICRAIGDLFHRMSPEDSLRQMLRKGA